MFLGFFFSMFFLSIWLSHFLCTGLPLTSGPKLVSGQGLGGPDSSGEIMKIHMENQARLQAMSQSDILEEQNKLSSQLGRENMFLVFFIVCCRTGHRDWTLKKNCIEKQGFINGSILQTVLKFEKRVCLGVVNGRLSQEWKCFFY